MASDQIFPTAACTTAGRVWALAGLSRYGEAQATGTTPGHVLEVHGHWRSLAALTISLATGVLSAHPTANPADVEQEIGKLP